jgi:Stress responsive A/B Barrel Domain
MIVHVVLINFRHGIPVDTRWECVRRLRELTTLVPGLTNLRAGLNVTTMERAWDMSMTAEFAALDEMTAYSTHPAHVDVQHFIDSYAADVIRIDFDPDSPPPVRGKSALTKAIS